MPGKTRFGSIMNVHFRLELGHLIRAWVAIFVVSLVITACQSQTPLTKQSACSSLVTGSTWKPPIVDAGNQEISFDELFKRIDKSRVILIGEYHDRYDHHLNQLELMCRLRARGRQIAIAVEFVQQPFQSIVDDYARGLIDEDEFLRQSEYFRRWGFDYRLYAPLLKFAKVHAIPVIALNIPGEITSTVALHGFGGLNETQSQYVPTSMMDADKTYRARLKKIFAAHEGTTMAEFDNFLDAQLLWDEGMAERAARYLKDTPHIQLLIFAGNGHVAHRNAIAGRLLARHPASLTIIGQDQTGPSDAHYTLRSVEQQLPAVGKLGVLLDDSEQGLRITSFTSQSAASDAGIEVEDHIVTINERATPTWPDIRLALWHKLPGDQVSIGIVRDGVEQTYELTLR